MDNKIGMNMLRLWKPANIRVRERPKTSCHVLPPRPYLDLPRPDLPTFGSTTVTLGEVSVAAERTRLMKRIRCILCEERNKNVLFLPCAYLKVCAQCAADVTMCPLCGQTVAEKVKTFMA